MIKASQEENAAPRKQCFGALQMIPLGKNARPDSLKSVQRPPGILLPKAEWRELFARGNVFTCDLPD